MKHCHYTLLLCAAAFLVGCQTTPPVSKSSVPVPEDKTPVVQQTPESSSKVQITPLPDHGIQSQSQPLPSAPIASVPPRVILPPQTTAPSNLKDGRGIAAYQKLMEDYLQSLRNNDIASAENYLIQAQRIAPQSADVYRELARLANLKKQGASAEAFARKGLTFAQNNAQRKQLWQQILQSAQLRNNAVLIQQAQQNIAKY
ncbi:MAG: tetratricopeptide repeat protein [Acinetobacter populi]|jgi:hypothetical protein|uniref:tetratricopeptide repeat protein n=1 Tax=Acinetobacter populi TaxID=1582270 RepID=UPI0023545042|nr:tetratricopeptide repeat protein [Acinetobacter populi]MCH4246499.1 tetratricopeptide repeat protein [Acinetobacter populi]